MNREQQLKHLEQAWDILSKSFEGLSYESMTEPGVTGDWSVKDILGHITTWDEKILGKLTALMEGQRAPRFPAINRFNAEQVDLKRDMKLPQVLKELSYIHKMVMEFAERMPETHFTTETSFRNKSEHYRQHADSIMAWRKAHES